MSKLKALAVALILAVHASGCGGGGNDVVINIRQPVSAGFFIGSTVDGENLSIAVDSIRSIFFSCGGVPTFAHFDPPLALADGRSFTVQFMAHGAVFTVSGHFTSNDELEGGIAGDPHCEGPFGAFRCDPATQRCGDADGDTIPDQIDNDGSSTPIATRTPGAVATPTSRTPTVTAGGHTPTSGGPTPTSSSELTAGAPTPTSTGPITTSVTTTSTPGGPTSTPQPTSTSTGPAPTATASGCTTATAVVSIAQPGGATDVVVQLTFPTTGANALSLPAGEQPAGRVSVPSPFQLATNNQNGTLRLVIGSSGTTIPAGELATIHFDCAAGATPPAMSAFTCAVTDAVNNTNSMEQPVQNVTCSVTQVSSP